jgi:hypothetical protein
VQAAAQSAIAAQADCAPGTHGMSVAVSRAKETDVEMRSVARLRRLTVMAIAHQFGIAFCPAHML